MSKLNTQPDYLYTQSLKKEQWAWEFLRRNPDYIKDYQWFITQWRALEKDYGKSPDMDYQAWKQDPRSYKIIEMGSEQDGNCAISEDKLLIECWMGNKWGFYQFPQNPELSALDIDITWRPLPPEYEAPNNPAESNKDELIHTINIDLSKSLKNQLELSKQKVIITQRRLRQQGKLNPFTLSGKKKLWLLCLNWLDSQNYLNDEFEKEQIQAESQYYLTYYLNILTLIEK